MNSAGMKSRIIAIKFLGNSIPTAEVRNIGGKRAQKNVLVIREAHQDSWGRRAMALLPGQTMARETNSYVFMILRPALRFLMRPFPPAAIAARFLAAVIRPPLVFFMAITPFHVRKPGDADD